MERITESEYQKACNDEPLNGTFLMFQFPGSWERLRLRREVAINKLRKSVENHEDTICLRKIINEECKQR